ncbi:MAG: YicC family protein [candidate division Zixibacteria bacterium]|nr:YicC family protein [candidate division Zixibacteria bacterium]
MNSMTGFGKAQMKGKPGAFTVEISSVNSRFLEISVRVPRQYSSLEHKVRELVSGNLDRGKVFVFAGFAETEDSPAKSYVNEKAMIAVSHRLLALRKKLKIAGDVTISDLLQFPDVTHLDNDVVDEKVLWAVLEKAVKGALKELLGMRRKEGAAMAKDMKQRLKTIGQANRMISTEAPKIVDKYRTRLYERVQDLLDNGTGDTGRVEQEIALFADRCDITEECTRLASHIDQYEGILREKKPMGKRLNFLLQEMNREANTMASKATETCITTAVISLKEEMEKLREMVQNVE